MPRLAASILTRTKAAGGKAMVLRVSAGGWPAMNWVISGPAAGGAGSGAVSYTHLTLPTNREV